MSKLKFCSQVLLGQYSQHFIFFVTLLSCRVYLHMLEGGGEFTSVNVT
jgi:hypothetical protein